MEARSARDEKRGRQDGKIPAELSWLLIWAPVRHSTMPSNAFETEIGRCERAALAQSDSRSAGNMFVLVCVFDPQQAHIDMILPCFLPVRLIRAAILFPQFLEPGGLEEPLRC